LAQHKAGGHHHARSHLRSRDSFNMDPDTVSEYDSITGPDQHATYITGRETRAEPGPEDDHDLAEDTPIGIIQFISELVNILHNILELKKLEFHMVDNSELKLEILSMVPNGLSVLKIASLVQIKLLVLSHLRETQIQLI